MIRKIALQVGYLTLIIGLLCACQAKPVNTPPSSSPTPAAPLTFVDREQNLGQGDGASVVVEDVDGGDVDAPPINADEVAVFLDQQMPQKLVDYKSAGAMISVVVNDEIIFTQGYGYANLEDQIPVDPEKTLFLIASVSKLFTWTAVMQLVEQAKIDLTADINQYLDFEIPATFPRPITMNDLMSHTSGFEEDNFERQQLTPPDEEGRREYFVTHMPARVREPGKFAAYSNYGTALAAYVVQHVSGVMFEDYLEQNVFQPLGMTRTSASEPVPMQFAADLARGYHRLEGSDHIEPVYYSKSPGAGTLASTALDIARFMLAHLQEGGPILNPETESLMQSPLATYHPRVNRILHGFFEMNQNGLRIFGHGGDIPGFHSILALIPEKSLGIFISFNSEVPSLAYDKTLEEFVDHFFPAIDPGPQVNPSLQNASRVAGSYRNMRSSYTSLEKVRGLLEQYYFKAQPDGTIIGGLNMMGMKPLGERQYVEVEPLVFQQVDGHDVVVFIEDENGNISHAANNLILSQAYERYPWYENPAVHMILWAVSYLVLIAFLIASGIRVLIKRKAKHPQLAPARAAQVLLVLASLFELVFLVLLYIATQDYFQYVIGNVGLYIAAFSLSTLAAIAAPFIVFFTVLVWKRQIWRPLRRLHYTLGAAAITALTLSFWVWNLIGWQF
jgi:CubicO group peptidase (beta-lactamase class C family)